MEEEEMLLILLTILSEILILATLDLLLQEIQIIAHQDLFKTTHRRNRLEVIAILNLLLCVTTLHQVIHVHLEEEIMAEEVMAEEAEVAEDHLVAEEEDKKIKISMLL